MSISEIKTAAKVRELRVHQRKCKFFSDGGLKVWPVYTWNMCVEECRMRVIQDRCKCRPHFARITGQGVKERVAITSIEMYIKELVFF